MPNYLYHTVIFKDMTSVYGVNSSQNATDKTDFETNRKSTAVGISSITTLETTIGFEKTYVQFSALVSSWADVNYIEESNHYDIYLLSGSLL